MTTDNRTNEPTPEQVEAAVHAAWVKSREFRGIGGQAEFAPPWEFQQVIRAALVAARGAVPPPSSGVDEDKLAEAWERGHAAFEQAWESDHLFPYDYATDNPYRKEKNE